MKTGIRDALMVVLTIPSVVIFVFVCSRAGKDSAIPENAAIPVICLLFLVTFSSLAAYFNYQKTSRSVWMEAFKTVDVIAGIISALPCLFLLLVCLLYFLNWATLHTMDFLFGN